MKEGQKRIMQPHSFALGTHKAECCTKRSKRNAEAHACTKLCTVAWAITAAKVVMGMMWQVKEHEPQKQKLSAQKVSHASMQDRKGGKHECKSPAQRSEALRHKLLLALCS
jgi:hypothetical protein